MQIVIDVPENVIECAKSSPNYYPTYHFEKIWKAIVNGIPLPKGHGELIDRDKIEYLKAIHDAKYGYITWGDAIKKIKYSAPTIIEADINKSQESEKINCKSTKCENCINHNYCDFEPQKNEE